VILSDPAGVRLGEVSLGTGVPPGVAKRHPAAQLWAAVGPNRADRAPTGDVLHVVVGRRACFGYAVGADCVRWFSHPRLARADAFGMRDDRAVRTWLYDLHADDPDVVSEIIWESCGPIRPHRAPALPAGLDPRAGVSPEYWTAIAHLLTAGGASVGRTGAVRGRSSDWGC
jgi:hypothetical protein